MRRRCPRAGANGEDDAITEWAACRQPRCSCATTTPTAIFRIHVDLVLRGTKALARAAEYLRRFRPDLVPTEDELHAVRFTSIQRRRSKR
jgi:hypothetical protein